MKVITVLGARPQFIKAGNVSRELASHRDLQEIIIHTGQHYDSNMSDIFFKQMQIPKPSYLLNIGGKSNGVMTGQMIEKIEGIVQKENPELMLVYGDTNSTLAGAIVASKLHVKLAHIEAGLRSFNMKMPEEINRILTDRVSNLLFCPTDIAVKNLKKEGYSNFPCKIIKSGDVMQDSAIFYKNLSIRPDYHIESDFILCTVHRAENTDNPKRLSAIFSALDKIAKDKQVILPLHPRTEKSLKKFNICIKNLQLVEPVGYLEMVWLINHCCLVMTDSGGLQKEAFFFKKPCITLRNETEWIELVDNNYNILAGANTNKILDTYYNIETSFNRSFQKNLYGNGTASKNIVSELLK